MTGRVCFSKQKFASFQPKKISAFCGRPFFSGCLTGPFINRISQCCYPTTMPTTPDCLHSPNKSVNCFFYRHIFLSMLCIPRRVLCATSLDSFIKQNQSSASAAVHRRASSVIKCLFSSPSPSTITERGKSVSSGQINHFHSFSFCYWRLLPVWQIKVAPKSTRKRRRHRVIEY